jgi:hypothetical protein
VHLDGVQGVEEFDPVELEDQFPQDLFAQEGGLFAIVEENDPKETIVLVARYLRHEELKVVDVKFAIEKLLLTRRVLPARHLTHVLLAAYLAPRPLIVTIILQNDLVVLAET